ncbi:hypothetical protein HMPREF0620_1221 [Parascardovia denticolens DSM 10105 = JCM 12538]|uniref:Uncharacterized protein n=1 Tax=Parascardovia denticolens DSM 10105 = JCM 12538 TaxID=864564 RepID=E6K0E3_PARDN|nr:hypothetical protein HMPREF0620_1221 [Parascardovia denticolens DSM 10105 = JCM 12538]BAR04967.1 hypothetical protein PSDT_0448 [Parascardovia denticolens DSM 10105 = JCM 12538]
MGSVLKIPSHGPIQRQDEVKSNYKQVVFTILFQKTATFCPFWPIFS